MFGYLLGLGRAGMNLRSLCSSISEALRELLAGAMIYPQVTGHEFAGTSIAYGPRTRVVIR